MVDKVTKAQLYKLQRTLRRDAKIGKELGVSRQAVHQLRKKFGIPALSAERPARDAGIVAAYIAGETGIAIAKRLGMSISQTYRIISLANGKAKRDAAVRRAGGALPAAAGKKAAAKKKTGKKSSKKKNVGRPPAAKKRAGKKRGKKR